MGRGKEQWYAFAGQVGGVIEDDLASLSAGRHNRPVMGGI